MGDCEFTLPDHEVQHHMVAAAQHILMALKACKNLNNDSIKVISDLNSYLTLSSMNCETDGGQLAELEEQLKQYEEVVMRWESSKAMIWDSGPTVASEYLDAVVEIQNLVGTIGGASASCASKQRELLNRSHGILEIAMSRLEAELIHILVQHNQYYEPEYMSFRSIPEDVVYDESFVSAEDETIVSTSRRDSSGNASEEFLVDLIQPDAIFAIKSIADAMFALDHGAEFCQIFVSVRRDALDEYLVTLNMKQLMIEDTRKMDCKALGNEIRKWVWALRIITRVYLASEKRLSTRILGGYGAVSLSCFIDIAKAAVLHFLNFGEAVAMAPQQPELLFRILDMHEALADLLPDIDALFIEEVGSFIRSEYHGLLDRLGDSAKASFAKFRHSVASYRPRKPFSGGVHPFTNYVMNYIRTFTVYGDTLNLLLDQEVDGLEPPDKHENGTENSSYSSSLLGRHVRLLASILVGNLEDRSKSFNHDALENIFMINNIHYMVKKIKGCDLICYFGDYWIRDQIREYQHRATIYIRATWSSALAMLTDTGKINFNPFSKSARERCRSFTIAFEEVYKFHTGYPVPDPQLREDLQIYTSRAIQAYRAFLGKHSAEIGEKHIKYSIDDLENYVLDFFEGSSKSLPTSRRR